MPGIDVFDKRSNEYDEWFERNRAVYESELAAIKKMLSKGKGLEIGVGSGLFAAPLGIEYGVEPSKTMRMKAAARGIKVIKGVAESLPFTEAEFDFCLMVTTVCFLDDIDLAFSEAYRVIKSGGSFIIGFVDRESPIGRRYLEKKQDSAFYKDATFYSVNELVEHLGKAGFNSFSFCQTLFSQLDEIQCPEPIKEGFGEGSFVVIRARRP